MEASVLTALAALIGAALGGFVSIITSWLTQRSKLRAQWTAQDIVQRQDLYKEFIEAASKCYVHALQHEEADIPAPVELYAKLGRMRVLSSDLVLQNAEQIERKILDPYLAPNKPYLDLRATINSEAVDLLREFSEACRAEFESLRAKQF